MPDKVHCRKYQKEMEALAAPPMPGSVGEELLATVSKQAWQEWQQHQTMLINELRLSMGDVETRQFLREEMWKFLDNKDYTKPEGYNPIDK